ncbi:MAG: hypothetical protein MJ252_17245 [archaeon]|nr:hypothetical protein [archaeon]
MSYQLKSILLIAFIFSFATSSLVNLQGEILNGEIKYHTVKVPKGNSVSQNMIITSTLSSVEKPTIPVLLASTSPLPNNDKSSQWLCGKIGTECKIPKEFLQRSDRVYFGVFCKKCQYSLDVDFIQGEVPEVDLLTQNDLRKAIKLPQIRLLQTANGQRLLQDPAQIVKFKKIKGSSVSGVAYLATFVIVVVIGCYIMMNIFVNTKLIKTPLKLGKIES